MNRSIILLSLTLVISLLSCRKDNEASITKSSLNGRVQKGPFLNGTAIDIYELDNDLSATGKAYSSQLLDNSGLFEFNNLSLVSGYVQIKASGFYFNEVTGENSASPITLFALSDISNKSSLNVNVLSNLEKARIEYLISQGISFAVAKIQAEQEILNIFSISQPEIAEFETLNIAEDGDNNAILLAISLITQGFRTESELSDLLANISSDIRVDGVLNNSALGTLLINDARLLNLQQIRTNIESRYANLGMSVTIPNFEQYINQFINNTSYQPNNVIQYPEFSTYGENILYADKTTFGSALSIAATLPEGTSLKIIIKGGLWAYQGFPNGPVNWTISQYNFDIQEQVFIATQSGMTSDLVFVWMGSGVHTIEYYENNATTPTRVKTIIT
jgi:hypothetical protein